jgi:hypothetical protein
MEKARRFGGKKALIKACGKSVPVNLTVFLPDDDKLRRNV